MSPSGMLQISASLRKPDSGMTVGLPVPRSKMLLLPMSTRPEKSPLAAGVVDAAPLCVSAVAAGIHRNVRDSKRRGRRQWTLLKAHDPGPPRF